MSDFNARFTELNTLLLSAQKSAERLKGGVKCESARARADLESMKKTINVLKKEVLDYNKSMPTKSRVRKADANAVCRSEVKDEEKPEVDNKENIPPMPELKRMSTDAPLDVPKATPTIVSTTSTRNPTIVKTSTKPIQPRQRQRGRPRKV